RALQKRRTSAGRSRIQSSRSLRSSSARNEDDPRHRGLSCLDPFFRIIEQGLEGRVDRGHFFDLLAEDVVFEFMITVPDYPGEVVGRDNLIELYRGYGSAFF